jgi:hypothetical protein
MLNHAVKAQLLLVQHAICTLMFTQAVNFTAPAEVAETYFRPVSSHHEAVISYWWPTQKARDAELCQCRVETVNKWSNVCNDMPLFHKRLAIVVILIMHLFNRGKYSDHASRL